MEPHCPTCRCHQSDADVALFLASDWVIEEPGQCVEVIDLYWGYRSWCADKQLVPVGAKRFSQALLSRGFARYRSNRTWYRGLGLLRIPYSLDASSPIPRRVS